MRIVTAFVCALVLVCFGVAPSSAEKRVALVVGNDHYPRLSADQQLEKAVNDSRTVAEAVSHLGFEVIRGENLDRQGLVYKLDEFTRRIEPGDVALFFFAGHGVNIGGGNYLLPSDVPNADAGQETLLARASLGENDIVSDLQAKGVRVAVVILDACRNNPFKRTGTRAVGGERGLGRVESAKGVFTLYSAGIGQTALDRLGASDPNPNSVFTRVLVPALAKPTLHLGDLAVEVREEVARLAASVGHDQRPAYYDETTGGRIYLAARTSPPAQPGQGSDVPTSSPDVPPPAPGPKPAPAKHDEAFELFGNAFERVRADYVDKPDEKKLLSAAIDGMLKAFPPPARIASSGRITELRSSMATLEAPATCPTPPCSGSVSLYRALNIFAEVANEVLKDHNSEGDDMRAVEAALKSMLASLDPHSYYLTAKALRAMQVDNKGEFGGLGVEVNMQDGLLKVVAAIDETPAARAGILAKDVITHLDHEPVQGLSLAEAVEKMRGPVNAKIILTIVRQGRDKPFDVTLAREFIRVRTIRSRLEDGDVGYIRITKFNQQTTDALKTAVADLAKQAGNRLKGFVLDLRNNAGGLLDQAISVADAFLEKGEIVAMRGRRAEEVKRFNARPGDLAMGKPIIVLINGGTGSGSEIVAGALQDHKRATLIGSRSFGNGSVQTVFPLGKDRGAVRFTTSRFFTPSGRSIQAKGIAPDIEVLQDVLESQQPRPRARSEAEMPGHLKADGEEQTGSQSYVPPDTKDDKALHTALGLLRGSLVNAAFPPRAR